MHFRYYFWLGQLCFGTVHVLYGCAAVGARCLIRPRHLLLPRIGWSGCCWLDMIGDT